MRKKVAFVVQRCGSEVNGGSEQHCLSVAQQMSKHWDVDIITTCALDYTTWENYFPHGQDYIGPVRVLRFPVKEPRNMKKFNKLSETIRANIGFNSKEQEEAWMMAQGPWSPDLFNYLSSRKSEYDSFIFFTYLYATTYFGLPLVKEKAYLVPTAHDEWPIYLGIWEEFFKLPRKFIFNTIEERDFLKQRFPECTIEGPVVGLAVDPPEDVDPNRFCQKFNITNQYLLYMGRIDQSKGCDQLIDYFLQYGSETGDYETKLVLMGKSVMEIPNHPNIVNTGFVDDQTKWDAVAGCELLVMPSQYESLSMVCLEAWAMGKPVLVNGNCEVLVGQCRRSQGGVWYQNVDEFIAALKLLTSSNKYILGWQGAQFVQENYTWDKIISFYQKTINF